MRSAPAMPNTPLGILPPEPGCCGMETWAIGLLLKSCENNRRQPLRPAELSSAIAVNCWSSVDMGAAPRTIGPNGNLTQAATASALIGHSRSHAGEAWFFPALAGPHIRRAPRAGGRNTAWALDV